MYKTSVGNGLYMNNISYHIKNIGTKLLSLKSIKRLNKADQETIDEILDTDIVLIQTLLKAKTDESEAKNTT